VDDLSYHRIWKQNQQPFSEVRDRAEWGNIVRGARFLSNVSTNISQYYATDVSPGLTAQSGADDIVRGRFISDGRLDDSKDSNFRSINDKWPVFGFAVNLGSVKEATNPTVFTIGLCQNEAIQFLGRDGLVVLPSLWKSFFEDDLDAVSPTLTKTLLGSG
jgi:hypothetical protein